MSIFAGAMVRSHSKNIPPALVEELRAAMSRHPDDAGKVQEFGDSKVFMAKLDLGILGTAGECFPPGLIAWVAGDPILHTAPNHRPLARAESLDILARDVSEDNYQSLRACRGTYCAVTYEPTRQRLRLIADKLGVRPIYCWVLPDFVVFATALRIIEAVSVFEKYMDLQGIAETSCFGAPLADRTPYQDIFCLLAGEVVCIDSTGSMQRTQYWRWDDLPLAEPSKVPAAQRIYQQFQEAVQLRLGNETLAAAHLSGGLDSRAVVAALRAANADVFTLNRSPVNSQDHILGQLAAEKLETHHTFIPVTPSMDVDRGNKAEMREWLDSPQYLARQPKCPRVIWSGDGGSVGMGHVYLNADIVEATRENNLERAIDIFIAYTGWVLSPKLLKEEIALNMSKMVRAGMLAELKNLNSVDTGRLFFLYLMLNDQRRHLAHHFDNLDIERIEFMRPFFDAEFLAVVMREKIDPFLRHAFYLDWLKCFPPGVAETPWQAYPGHVPCPLPLPKGLEYQWDEATLKRSRTTSSVVLKQARGLEKNKRYAREFLSSGHMRMFKALLWLRRNEYAYLLNLPELLLLYWKRSNGATDTQRKPHNQEIA